MGTIFQFWRGEILLLLILALLSSLFVLFFHGYLITIPRNGIPFLATVFSTLLGLTFTAFSIIGAFIPNMERDFLNTHTFEVFEETFRLTMLLELLALIVSIIDYFAYDTIYIQYGIYALTILITISLGFMGYLLNKTFEIFRITRSKLINK